MSAAADQLTIVEPGGSGKPVDLNGSRSYRANEGWQSVESVEFKLNETE